MDEMGESVVRSPHVRMPFDLRARLMCFRARNPVCYGLNKHRTVPYVAPAAGALFKSQRTRIFAQGMKKARLLRSFLYSVLFDTRRIFSLLLYFVDPSPLRLWLQVVRFRMPGAGNPQSRCLWLC